MTGTADCTTLRRHFAYDARRDSLLEIALDAKYFCCVLVAKSTIVQVLPLTFTSVTPSQLILTSSAYKRWARAACSGKESFGSSGSCRETVNHSESCAWGLRALVSCCSSKVADAAWWISGVSRACDVGNCAVRRLQSSDGESASRP